MRFPRFLRIMHRRWSVSRAKKRPKWADQRDMGAAERNLKGLYVAPTKNVESDLETLCHEILHGLFDMAPGAGFDDGTEERVCDALEGPLASLLMDNDLSCFRRKK